MIHCTTRLLPDGSRWYSFLLGLGTDRRPAAERPNWHSLAVQLQTTTDRQREIQRTRELPIAQSLIQEGREESKKGRQEGGRTGFLLACSKNLIRFAINDRGRPDETTREVIDRIDDADRLDRMTERIDETSSWADLLATT